MGTLSVMAQTVTIRNSTGQQFRATRHQWERLWAPAGCTLIVDEDGNPPTPTRKVKATPPTDPTEQENS